MERRLVWDLPVRLFHGGLAASVTAAAAIALVGGEETAVFPLHMLLGAVAAAMVLLRIVWGFLGTRHARLGALLVSPAAILAYLTAMARGRPERHVGHNPAAAAAIVAMLLLVLGLAVTGVLMARGIEAVEELHEILAYALVAVVAVHLLGVAVHTIVHRENIVRGMVDGRKEAEAAESIPSARPLAAIIGLALVAGFAAWILAGYDGVSRTVRIAPFGLVLDVGEEGDGPGQEDDGDRD